MNTTRYRGIGKTGLALAAAAMIAMCVTAFLIHPSNDFRVNSEYASRRPICGK